MLFVRDESGSRISLKRSLGYVQTSLLFLLSMNTEHPNNTSYVSMKLFFVYADSFCYLLYELFTVILILPLDTLSGFDVETIYFWKSAATALLGYSLLYLVGPALRGSGRIMLLLYRSICQRTFWQFHVPDLGFLWLIKKQPLCLPKSCNQHLVTIPNTEVLIGSITEKVRLFQGKNRM